jgi:hypothetical protein
VPASPKCGNSFFWSRLIAMRSQKRIAMSAILAAPLATIGHPHSTKLATFTEPARLQPADPDQVQLRRVMNLNPWRRPIVLDGGLSRWHEMALRHVDRLLSRQHTEQADKGDHWRHRRADLDEAIGRAHHQPMSRDTRYPVVTTSLFLRAGAIGKGGARELPSWNSL